MTSGGSATDPALIASVYVEVPAWRVDRPFDYAVPDDLRANVQEGTLVRVPFGARSVRGIVWSVSEGDPEGLESIQRAYFDVPICPSDLRHVCGLVAERHVVPMTRVLQRCVPPRVRVGREPIGERAGDRERFDWSDYKGARSLLQAIENGGGGTWCLRPLTTDRPSQLIADLVAAAWARDRSALVLIPEVGHGSAIAEGLTAAGLDPARVDSGIEDAQRARSWVRLARGHPLGIGGRGAIFTAMPDLGLIVVHDEPHVSYKEERAPRFDARRVAVERAKACGATCVFVGSAPTLDLEGFDEISFVEPQRAAARAARPIVELAPLPPGGAAGSEMHERIRDALRAGGRVAVLAPRRGWARVVWCGACRRSLHCPRCDSGISAGEGGTRCTVCGWWAPPPERCPSCGASEWRLVAPGGERIADRLARAFPRHRILAVNPLDLPDPEAVERSQIYVTTWIGTKPELRPDVGLVGIIDADALIRRPYWRAAEDSYQALAAMADWAGPAASGGRLLIQTSDPAHHAIQAIVRADHDFFVRKESDLRRELGYPPFGELVEVSSTGPNAAEVLARCGDMAATLGARVLGPIEKPGAEEAITSLLKCPSALQVAQGLRVILTSLGPGSNLRVDVDPR